MASGRRGGDRDVSWTVPLRYYESSLLNAMFEVLRARAGQRVSRARWLLARAQLLLQEASTDESLRPHDRDFAARALTNYQQAEQRQAERAATRQTTPSWETLTR
ncbi:MAG: hypothetical protein ACP5QO_16665 [Clostridia bacterium]